MDSDYFDSIDWVFYLKRETPFFSLSTWTLNYGIGLEKETGFGFTHQVSFYKNGFGYCFRSEKEMKEVDNYYAKLIENNSPKLEKLFEKEKQIHEKVDEAKSYSDNQKIDFFVEASLFNTIIPYRLFSALETIENKPKEFEERLEKIRGGISLYPILIDSLLGKLFEMAGKKLGVSKESATLVTPYELKDVLNGKLLISKEELEERNTASYIVRKNAELDIESGTPKFVGDYLSQRGKELKGQIAFKGKAEGTVKIVNIPKQIEKIEQGDILVSINTNPSIMPAIKKAGAIVTDEGGALCHAAIISRELKIPCITGTKHATDILKDGDRVIVDAEKGIVKKL